MCNDRISRQALLDEINEEIEYGEEHFRPENEQINKGLKIARKLVRALPTIESEPDNGWISVEDELPNISTTTHTSQLVMVYSTDNEYEMYFDVYNGLSGRFMSEAQNGCKVTYWRPLPEPPKGV